MTVQSRPSVGSGHRDPTPSWIASSGDFLRRNINTVTVAVVVAAAGVALAYLQEQRSETLTAFYSQQLQGAMKELEQNPKKAAESLEQILKQNPNAPQAPWMLATVGDAYSHLGLAAQKPEEAAPLFRKALDGYRAARARFPNHLAATYALFGIFQVSEELGESINASQAARELVRDHRHTPPAQQILERYFGTTSPSDEDLEKLESKVQADIRTYQELKSSIPPEKLPTEGAPKDAATQNPAEEKPPAPEEKHEEKKDAVPPEKK